MGFAKPDEEKDLHCRQCNSFLDTEDLNDDGMCPYCETDDYIYHNELKDEL